MEENRLSVDELLERATPLVHKPNLNRLTYYVSLIHQHRGDEPKGIQKAGTIPLNTKEEPWSRRLEITSAPRPIPSGWLENPNRVGFISVQNLAGVGLDVKPTEEEALAIKNSMVMVYYEGCTEGFIVPPEYPQIIFPTNIEKLRIKCLNVDSVVCRITIFPR